LLELGSPLVSGVNEHLSIKSAGLHQKRSYTEITAFQNSFGQAVSGARLNCKGHPHELHLSLSDF
jgi:hypothetical protein